MRLRPLTEIDMKPNPTFEQLREANELDVVNPATGIRFRISLRNWAGSLWAVRVYPQSSSPSNHNNPYVTSHRLMGRETIKEWLSQLKLAHCKED